MILEWVGNCLGASAMIRLYRWFLPYVTAAIFVSQNNEMAAIFVSQNNEMAAIFLSQNNEMAAIRARK